MRDMWMKIYAAHQSVQEDTSSCEDGDTTKDTEYAGHSLLTTVTENIIRQLA